MFASKQAKTGGTLHSSPGSSPASTTVGSAALRKDFEARHLFIRYSGFSELEDVIESILIPMLASGGSSLTHGSDGQPLSKEAKAELKAQVAYPDLLNNVLPGMLAHGPKAFISAVQRSVMEMAVVSALLLSVILPLAIDPPDHITEREDNDPIKLVYHVSAFAGSLAHLYTIMTSVMMTWADTWSTRDADVLLWAVRRNPPADYDAANRFFVAVAFGLIMMLVAGHSWLSAGPSNMYTMSIVYAYLLAVIVGCGRTSINMNWSRSDTNSVIHSHLGEWPYGKYFIQNNWPG
eukprot:gene27216-16501_t